MIEKKDPAQKIFGDDFSDDDPIIELTDEVITKPEEGRRAASPKTDDYLPPKADKDPSLWEDEGTVVFEENAKSSPQDDPFTEADTQVADDAIEMAGDETRINFNEEIEIEYESDGDEVDFFPDDDELAEDNSVIAMPSDVSSTFGEDDNGIDILSDIEFELEEGEEIIPFNELDEAEVQTDDDIIEITEFDQHFPDDEEYL